MKGDLCLPGKLSIANEVLAYLVEHPKAQDTLEGIVKWWLLERKIKYQTGLVNEAIQELVEKGLILENKKHKPFTYYRLNQRKKREIQALVRKDG